jgi:hypothetical protein
VFRDVSRPVYGEELAHELGEARANVGPDELEKLLHAGETWTVGREVGASRRRVISAGRGWAGQGSVRSVGHLEHARGVPGWWRPACKPAKQRRRPVVWRVVPAQDP